MELSTEKLDYQIGGTTFNHASCYYCGGVGNTTDHVPPRSTRKMLESAEAAGAKIHHYQYFEVPCCHECNSALNDKLCTLKERKAYIAVWLAKRYRKLLKMPEWTEHELSTMSDNMQRLIRANAAKREVAKARVQWACFGVNVNARVFKEKPPQRRMRPRWPKWRNWKCASGEHCINLGKEFRKHGKLYCSLACRNNFYRQLISFKNLSEQLGLA